MLHFFLKVFVVFKFRFDSLSIQQVNSKHISLYSNFDSLVFDRFWLCMYLMYIVCVSFLYRFGLGIEGAGTRLALV